MPVRDRSADGVRSPWLQHRADVRAKVDPGAVHPRRDGDLEWLASGVPRQNIAAWIAETSGVLGSRPNVNCSAVARPSPTRDET